MKKTVFSLVLIAFVLASCQKNHPHYPGPVQDDSKLISGWIGLHMRLIRNTTGVTHIAFSRHFSYTGVALYESLAGGAPGYRSIASHLSGNLQIPASPKGVKVFHPAAANAAMAAMLRFFYNAKPENVSGIDSLEEVYHQKLEELADDKYDLDASAAYGQHVAAVVIEWSKQDGSGDANIPYTVQGEGYWEPTPPANASANLPGWGNNRAIVPGSSNGAIPAAPVAFSKEPGSPFYTMVKKVYDVSAALTEEQKAIAFFWDDAPNGKYLSVFGHWFSVFKQVLDRERTPLMKGAEAYLRLGIAMNDATISCWKAKYQYHTIRPITYIRNYMNDANWNTLISTPPHPEYSSAHSTISASATYALESVFGKYYSFTDHSYDIIGLNPRSFSSFDAAAKEAGLSRLYAGIHFEPSIEAGYQQGRKVGANVVGKLKTR